MKDPNGKIIGISEIPVDLDPVYMETPSVITSENFGIPEFLQAGNRSSVPGVFDGDFSTTRLDIGGKNVDILAESPRGIFFESPDDISGKTEIKLNECNVEATGQTTAYNLSLTADKLALQRGDKTTVHIRIDGLTGLDKEIPVEINNLTVNTVTVEGGNQQSITIRPEDVGQDGIYTADLPVTAISSGGFSVAVNVKPPEPVVISRIYPIDETGSPMPNFVWSVINRPPDCSYSITVWDVRSFDNPQEMADFTFTPETVDGLQPLISKDGLEEPSFSLSTMEGTQLKPDHMYVWQVGVISEGQPMINSGMWNFTVNGQVVKNDYVHIRDGQYASKYYPRGWVHIRRGDYASKIYNPATHRHLTAKEYNTKIYSSEDYIHITEDADKTKIYPKNMRHITSGSNESHLYNPENFDPDSCNILFGRRTGFAFFDDTIHSRKILVGADAHNVLKNNWYDGPFDQLPDNHVKTGEIEIRKYIEAAYPADSGRIDRYGNFLDQKGVRVAIAPYYAYYSKQELIDYVRECIREEKDFTRLYTCLTQQIFYLE